jgi:hypothetical protein
VLQAIPGELPGLPILRDPGVSLKGVPFSFFVFFNFDLFFE